MLSFCSNELSRRASWTCFSCSVLSRNGPSITGTQRLAQVRAHERRHSSSKTSNSSKQEPGALATSTDPSSEKVKEDPKVVPSNTVGPTKRATSRSNRKRTKDSEAKLEHSLARNPQSNLPSVPSTQDLHPLKIYLGSFFSAHRPLSITNAIPPPNADAAFSSLFEAKRTTKRSSADVIQTLSSVVDSLEQASYQQEQQDLNSQYMGPEDFDLHAAVAQASRSGGQEETHNADISADASYIDLRELAKTFKPYSPPPPPIPLGALQEAAATQSKSSKNEKARLSRLPRRTSYKATITIYETTDQNGKKTYETISSPLVVESTQERNTKNSSQSSTSGKPPSLSKGKTQQSQISERFQTSSFDSKPAQFFIQQDQPFLNRMYIRQLRYEHRMNERYDHRSTYAINPSTISPPMDHEDAEAEDAGPAIWQFISVKRQRKLKMKKHKYKKLMKRTKNLRRRQDRL